MYIKVYQYRSAIGVFKLIVSSKSCELRLGGEVLGNYSSTTAALAHAQTSISARFESDILETINIPLKLSEWEKIAG